MFSAVRTLKFCVNGWKGLQAGVSLISPIDCEAAKEALGLLIYLSAS